MERVSQAAPNQSPMDKVHFVREAESHSCEWLLPSTGDNSGYPPPLPPLPYSLDRKIKNNARIFGEGAPVIQIFSYFFVAKMLSLS